MKKELKKKLHRICKTTGENGMEAHLVSDTKYSKLQKLFDETIEQERNDIWKWIGENSWVQDSPTGEVRVIDVDELADYWRKQDRK